MRICPNADPTDGELDVTIIHPVSRLKPFGCCRDVLRPIRDPCVEQLRAREITWKPDLSATGTAS
jgi:diacylglycerol kinase (ATP)